MTDLVDAPVGPFTLREVAAAAAASAGVEIRLVDDLPGLRAVERLWTDTWYPGTDQSPVSRDLMRAMTHAGAYLGAAYDGDRLVGAGFGFFGTPGHRHLHSHLAAVTPGHRSRNVGRAIKLHQRAWALEQGATSVTWTVDPLVRRNAHFNIASLGATPVAYLTDFYGAMDGINAGQGSDRLLMSWPVTEPVPPVVGVLDRGDAEPVLTVGPDERPEVRARRTDGPVRVQVPADVEALRRADPALGVAWRAAVREVLGGLVADGAEVVGFTRDGSYLVQPPAPSGPSGPSAPSEEPAP